jgi:hypothetical protein
MSIRPWDRTRKEEIFAFTGGSSLRRNVITGHRAGELGSTVIIAPAAVVK